MTVTPDSASPEKTPKPSRRDTAGVQAAVAASAAAYDPFVERLFGGAPAEPPKSAAGSLSVQRLKAPVLQRAQRPVDLTEQVRQSSPPSPRELLSEAERAAMEALADTVSLEVLEFRGTRDEPSRFTASLRLDGRVFDLAGELYAGVGRIPVLFWKSGPDLDSFSKAQHYAIQRALTRLCENNERPESRADE